MKVLIMNEANLMHIVTNIRAFIIPEYSPS